MRRILAFTVLAASLNAMAAPASQESVESLLVAAKAQTGMESMFANMEQIMRQGMAQAQAAQNQPITAEQQRVIDTLPAKFAAMMREEMSWDKLKPLYVQIYRESFDQEEVDGLLAFYGSPAGRAFVNKMPLVMQKSMAMSQSLLQSMMPRIQAVMKETAEEMAKAAR